MLRLLSIVLIPLALAQVPTGTPQSPATLIVRVPAEAALFFGDVPTLVTGVERRFASPPLAHGSTYEYVLKFRLKDRDVIRNVAVKPGESTTVTVTLADFDDAAGPGDAKKPPARSGFLLKEESGYWWIFRDGSKEAKDAEKDGWPEKHVARLNAGPGKFKVKSPDADTLDEYMLAKPGFVTKLEDGRLWVFKADSKELADFRKHGELAKQVVRPNAGPGGRTLKAPDAETIVAYVVAQDGFETILDDGRLWVFRTGSKELTEFRKHHELEKHVIRINAGPLGMTIKMPDVETIEAYKQATQPQP